MIRLRAALVCALGAAERHRVGRKDDCGPPARVKVRSDAVRAYLRAVYPHMRPHSNRTLRALYDSLDYVYAPSAAREGRLVPSRGVRGDAPPPPYLAAGWYYEASPARQARWVGGASRSRWPRPARYRAPRASADGAFSTVGARFGPAPSWTSPLAVVRVPFALAAADDGAAPPREALLRWRADDAAVARALALDDGSYAEVEQFGGARWARSGCPPVCGTWANLWRGTGVFMRLSRPFASLTRTTALAEMVREVAARAGGEKALDAIAASAGYGAFYGALRARSPSAGVGDAHAAALLRGDGCRCGRDGDARPAYDGASDPAAYAASLRRGAPEDWCAAVCGTGPFYDRKRRPWAAYDALLAALACLLGRRAVVLARSANDNGYFHQELVDFDVPASLGGWPDAPAGGLNGLECLAPFFPDGADDRDARLAAHWAATRKFATCDPTDPAPCARDPGPCRLGPDAATARDRCRTFADDPPTADRACYVACAGALAEAHANVSITQVLAGGAAGAGCA